MEYLDVNKFHPKEISLKFLILGKSSTGKSMFSQRINTKYQEFTKFKDNYLQTVGFEFYTQKIRIGNHIFRINFWDCCGQELYRSLIQNFYKNACAFLIFYDSCDKDSFIKAKFWIEDIFKFNPKSFCVLIRNKYELIPKDKIVADEEALEYAYQKNIYFSHISSFQKYETGIEELIQFSISQYYKNINDSNKVNLI